MDNREGRQRDEEQIQAPLQGEKKEKDAKPAWVKNNDLSPTAILTVASILMQLLLGNTTIEELDDNLTIFLFWILFLGCMLAIILMVLKREISGKDLSQNKKKMLMSFNLLSNTVIMIANAVFLGMVNKAYIGLISVPVVGGILVAVLFYFDLKWNQENQNTESTGGTLPQEESGDADTEANASMVKNCYDIANAVTSTGYVILTAVCIVYIKNPNYQKQHPDQYILMIPLLASCVASFAGTITSSPLGFQSDFMGDFLKQITSIMVVLLGFAVVFVSAECPIDAIEVVAAVMIPFTEMFMVNLSQKSMKKKAADGNLPCIETGEEVDNSMFIALVRFCTVILCAIYSVKVMGEGYTYTSYLKFSVSFLLLSTIASLLRIAFPLDPACKALKYVHDGLPIVGALAGLALLLIEICVYITKLRKAGESIPLLGPISSFPPK